jgi:hypothetical protein
MSNCNAGSNPDAITYGSIVPKHEGGSNLGITILNTSMLF